MMEWITTTAGAATVAAVVAVVGPLLIKVFTWFKARGMKRAQDDADYKATRKALDHEDPVRNADDARERLREWDALDAAKAKRKP